MRAYLADGNRLEIADNPRIDEEILFDSVMKKLRQNSNIEIGLKKIGPSEDYYSCSIVNLPFTLFYDIDYGTSIYSDNPEALQMLSEVLNQTKED